MDRTQSLVIVLALAAVAWALVTLVPGVVAGAAHRYARSIDLELRPPAADDVLARMRRRARAGAWGGALAVLAVVVAAALRAGAGPADPAFLVGEEGLGGLLPVVVVGAYFLGHALGHAGVAWAQIRRPAAPPGPRLARVRTPTHTDYVAPHERWGGWVAAGIAVLVPGVLLIALAVGLGDLGSVPWPLVAVSVVLPGLAMAAYEVAARRVLDRGQVATTPLGLAWDDALRSRMLRDILTAALFVAYALPLALLLQVAQRLREARPDSAAGDLVSGSVTLLVLLGVVVALVSLGLRPHRHFRERLWPEPVPAGPAAGAAGATEGGR